MSAEIFDMKLYKKALKIAKKGKALKLKPQSSVAYEGEKQIQIDAEQIRALQKQNGELTDKVKELEQQIEKMKKYIKACWVEENLNDYSSYITNTSDEFRDLVKELNEEIRNGR